MSLIRKAFAGMGKEKVLAAAYAVVIAAGFAHLGLRGGGGDSVSVFAMPVGNKIVVIDAGHGGWDPGMIGVTKTNEKEINLAIAERLQKFLEMGGATVLVTRAEDEALADNKRDDLQARSDLAEQADALISIHQNQFTSPSVRGAQVFYHTGSEDGKLLAECVQQSFYDYLDKSRKRIAKANSDYYLLRKPSCPSIIVECGFLSNREDEKLLTDEEYQERVAWTIYIGIINYFSQKRVNAASE